MDEDDGLNLSDFASLPYVFEGLADADCDDGSRSLFIRTSCFRFISSSGVDDVEKNRDFPDDTTRITGGSGNRSSYVLGSAKIGRGIVLSDLPDISSPSRCFNSDPPSEDALS